MSRARPGGSGFRQSGSAGISYCTMKTVAWILTVVFGLAFSKLITLGLVPAMLAMPIRVRERTGHGVWRLLWNTFLKLLGLPVRLVGGLVRRLSGRQAVVDATPAE